MGMRRLALCTTVLLAVVGVAPAVQAQQAAGILRDRLAIVAASNADKVATLLIQGFRDRYGDTPSPELQSLGTSRAAALFCAGTGAAMADILVTTRRLSSAARDYCAANGVEETVELRLGHGAVVLAVRRGDPQPGLASRQVHEALAAETAVDRGFDRNRTTLWSQIGAGLPAEQIRFILPAAGSGLRELFEDTVLESGCRTLRQIRLIFEAEARRDRCITLRADGRVTELATGEIGGRLITSQRGTIAVTSLDEVTRSGGNLVALALDGVVPTRATIASGQYEATRSFYLYAKRQHARSLRGVGVVRGIAEFLAEASSEAAAGPSGYLAQSGLVPLPTTDRLAQRIAAERMTVMQPR